MTDYKEICETLRLANSWQFAPGYVEAMLKAADAIEQLVKMARQLCEGFLDMPSGCDGCPLVDTQILDEEGNGICALYRRSSDE